MKLSDKLSGLAVLFASAALTSCVGVNDNDFPVIPTRPYAHHIPYYGPGSGALPGEASPRSRQFYDASIPKPSFEELVGPGVRILDYQHATGDEKKACTQLERRAYGGHPLTYPIYKNLQINYDVNQDGQTVNIEVVNESVTDGYQKLIASRAIRATLFRPPVLNGEKLYCQHVNEDYYWGTAPYERTRSPQ